MGASAREIEQQIKATRERIDEHLGLLESRAATGWRRYGKIAATTAAAATSVGVGLIVWRRTRRPKPSFNVIVNEKNQRPGLLRSIVRKVAPAVIGTAATRLIERAARRRDSSSAQAE
jgi:hypothetical protein